MISIISWIVLSFYASAALGLLCYGINCYVMLYLFLRKKDENLLEEQQYIEGFYREKSTDDLPAVTTQIPIYNEYNVAVRIIRAVAAIDYPEGKHQIQVLDDSTDSTRELIDKEVKSLKSKGIDITVIRRISRTGFKAGALANGLKSARGELLAIFDADFIPEKDFLFRTAPLFLRNKKLGIVQTRWGHTNSNNSLLTRIQALGIDGHFMVEQPARAWNGLFMNFNGTAGILRIRAIVEAGGWQCDTITEDMDLSYRIQLKGWEVHYSLSTVVPAELPENIHAFKTQQFRWAKGSIQTAFKLLGSVMKSNWSVFAKFQAFMHLTHYCVHPLMLTLSLLALPVLLTFPVKLPHGIFAFFAFFLVLSMTGPSSLYTGSQVSLGPGWLNRIKYLPVLVCMGVGLALSNTRGVLEAFMGKQSPFVRTPKKGERELINYHSNESLTMVSELTLGIYCFISFVFYLSEQKYLIGPFLAIYSAGFLYIAVLGFFHSIHVKTNLYRPVLTAICGLFLIASCFWLGTNGIIGSQFPAFIAVYACMWLAALAFFLILPKTISRIRIEVWIFVIAAFCRLALFNLPAGGDINRYLWEAKMINYDVNPYAVAPDDPSLLPLRDDVWKGINHADMTACYPPGSLYFFSRLIKFGYSKHLLKAVFIAFDLAALMVIFALLRKKKKNPRFAAAYALNPVILISFAGQAHLDSIMIFFMSAALLAYYYRRWILMFILMALAVQSKQIAIVIFPLILKRENMRYCWIFALGVLAPFVPFMENSIIDPFKSLAAFSMTMAHNGSVHGLLRLFTGSIQTATFICMVLFILFYSCSFFFKRRDPLFLALYSFAALILLSPTVHFWYLSWIIPFLCFFPLWSWIVSCLTIALYFIADWIFLQGGVWYQPAVIQILQWLPVYAVLTYEIARAVTNRSAGLDFVQPRSVSIIVPVLNAADNIDECLMKIRGLKPCPLEVLVVDGGSSDDTVEKALAHNVKLIKSSFGRGRQILEGLKQARGDVCAVLHVDTYLEPDTLGRILNSFLEHSNTIGGSVGQRFSESGFSLILIEILNDLRAALFGISFGDQVQFFRTQIALSHNIVPQWPLMEDVEISLRLGRLGRRVYLWGGAVVSNYKWQQGFAKRFFKVMYLLSVFFIRKLTRRMNTKDLYNIYYGKTRPANE